MGDVVFPRSPSLRYKKLARSTTFASLPPPLRVSTTNHHDIGGYRGGGHSLPFSHTMLNLLSYVALVLGTSLIGIIVTLALVPSLRIKFFRMREGGDLALFPWIGDDVSLLTGHLHLTEPGPRNLQDHLRWMKNSPSGAYVLWAGIFWPVLNLMSPEVVQPILKSTSPKSYPYTKIHPWLGISLLTSAGDLWKRKRRQITPAFHYTILQGFQPVFCEKTELMLEHMGHAADSATPVDVFRLITLCTLDIIGMCAFGYEINASTEPNSPYVLATYELSELFYRRLFDPLLLLMPEFLYERITDSGRRWRRALDIIHKLPETVIAKRREGLQKGIDTGISVVAHQREYVDFLHILLTATDENGQPLTNQEIRDEVDTFMFEGHGMMDPCHTSRSFTHSFIHSLDHRYDIVRLGVGHVLYRHQSGRAGSRDPRGR